MAAAPDRMNAELRADITLGAPLDFIHTETSQYRLRQERAEEEAEEGAEEGEEPLYLHDLNFFVLEMIIDGFDEAIG